MKKIHYIDYFEIELNVLLKEYELIKNLLEDVLTHGNKVLVQKKFHLVRDRQVRYSLENLPYTREVIQKVKNIFQFTDATYRMVMPNTAYNWHYDKGSICYHIPLISNLGCFFVYEDQVYNMLPGKLYKVQNNCYHTFVNAGPEPRVHITFENL